MTCIWCRRASPDVSFNKRAHTFQVSLGGEHICENVCDSCNAYFGSPQQKLPSIEVVFKEVLNVSKYMLLDTIDKREQTIRFKSEYFDIDWKRRRVKTKSRFGSGHA